jgi:uncharacterized protein YcfL
MSILGLVLLVSLLAVGCGSGSKTQTPVSQVTVMVIGTSGSISHSAALTTTIN